MKTNLEGLEKLDKADPLANLRQHFALPDPGLYFGGHSLGAMPKNTPDRIDQVCKQWAEKAVSAWPEAGWYEAPLRVGSKLAPLVGAGPNEVLACDSTSINLFKVLTAALRLRPERKILLLDDRNFPADLYIAQALAQFLPDLELKYANPKDIPEQLNNQVAVLLMSHVDYKSAELFDMSALTQAAHDCGALAVWDLSHSLGLMPIALNQCQVDFAVASTYKYLHAGPGAPALLFCAQKHLGQGYPALSGWMGHQKPFDFAADFQGSGDIKEFLCGTHPVLGLTGLEAALEVFENINLAEVQVKNRQLSEVMIELLSEKCPSLKLLSPNDAELRGGHLAFTTGHAFGLSQALLDQHITVDYRAPESVRFGLSPLTLRYQDLWETALKIEDILSTQSHLKPQYQRKGTIT